MRTHIGSNMSFNGFSTDFDGGVLWARHWRSIPLGMQWAHVAGSEPISVSKWACLSLPIFCTQNEHNRSALPKRDSRASVCGQQHVVAQHVIRAAAADFEGTIA